MASDTTAMQILLFILSNIVSNYNKDDTEAFSQQKVKQSYDFVIIGGGTAGCVVASRLSEISDFNVLLIELGGDSSAYSDIGMLGGFEFTATPLLPEYNSTKQDNLCGSTNGICSLVWGRVLGGCSTVGGLDFVRSFNIDYNEWVGLGATGWSFNDVLPFYKKMETFHPEPGLPYDPDRRGESGPIQITTQQDYPQELGAAVGAAIERGFQIRDPNDMIPGRIAYYHQRNWYNGVRVNMRRAYLPPSVVNRPNLDIVLFSRATKINFNGNKAVSVDYERHGKKYNVKVDREVIVTAGAIETPKLLMLSGVGDRQELRKFGIQVVNELPGVGKQLHDHPRLSLFFELDHLAFHPVTDPDVDKYNEKEKKGLLAKYYKLFNAYFKVRPTDPEIITSSIEIGFPETRLTPYFPLQEEEFKSKKSHLESLIKIVQPKSEGSVRLKSTNPYDDPIINLGVLTALPDRIKYRETVKQALEFYDAPSWKSIGLKFIPFDAPKCDKFKMFGNRSNPYIDCVIQQLTVSDTHFCRTCRMGDPRDPLTVVLPDSLKVKNLQNVRVMDASVFPKITRGNTVAPTVLVAEKGSEMIKKSYGVNTQSPVLEKDYDTRI